MQSRAKILVGLDVLISTVLSSSGITDMFEAGPVENALKPFYSVGFGVIADIKSRKSPNQK